MRSFLAKSAVLAFGAAAVTAALAMPANADPQQAVASTDITAAGSDTIQFVDDDLAKAYNATSPANLFDSWDAVNPTTGAVHEQITVKPGLTITRPDGSSEGINSLKAGNQGIDIARSSRGPQAGDVDADGNPLLFVPFAQDELRYATATTTDAPQSLTKQDLINIYTCSVTTWNQVGGSSTATIQPKIPQAGSGTRSFFEQQLGLTDSTLGSCVGVVQENEPSAEAGQPDAIGPFSVAQFNSRFTNAGIQLNTSGFDAFREVYNVVALDPTTGAVSAELSPLVGDGATAGSGYICSAAGQAVVHADGFASLSTAQFPNAACGVAEFFGE